MSTCRAIMVVDLAYGDCGKGTVVDFLARRYPDAVVVRFNGGPQAGHNVVCASGKHHTFSQFGSGALVGESVSGLTTFLSRFMLIEPYALLREAQHLNDIGPRYALDGLIIDERCPVITPAHQAANRLREIARAGEAHGTCGMGVGEAVKFGMEHASLVIRAGELGNRAIIKSKLLATIEVITSTLWLEGIPCVPSQATVAAELSAAATHAAETLHDPTWVDAAVDTYAGLAANVRIADPTAAESLLRESMTILFEGAQGVLLDESFGFHPHTTWSNTTFANAETLLDEARSDAERFRLGVLRTYFTRHGAGPLVTEDAVLAAALQEPHNTASGWQGKFRVGRFDAVAAKYALDVVGGVDALAITHLDRLPAAGPFVCTAYQRPEAEVTSRDILWEDAREIDRLPVRRPVDLAWQAQLTAALRDARPVCDDWSVDADGFCDRLHAETGTPVALRSFGPTAEDKVYRDV